MRIRTAAKRPMIFSLRLLDREIVDGCVAKAHQAIVPKLPILIAIGAKPILGIIVPFVSEPHRDAIAGVSPEFLDQPVVEFFRPLPLQKLNNFLPSAWKLGAISPTRVDCV